SPRPRWYWAAAGAGCRTAPVRSGFRGATMRRSWIDLDQVRRQFVQRSGIAHQPFGEDAADHVGVMFAVGGLHPDLATAVVDRLRTGHRIGGVAGEHYAQRVAP